jgi:hypothetical protein
VISSPGVVVTWAARSQQKKSGKKLIKEKKSSMKKAKSEEMEIKAEVFQVASSPGTGSQQELVNSSQTSENPDKKKPSGEKKATKKLGRPRKVTFLSVDDLSLAGSSRTGHDTSQGLAKKEKSVAKKMKSLNKLKEVSLEEAFSPSTERKQVLDSSQTSKNSDKEPSGGKLTGAETTVGKKKVGRPRKETTSAEGQDGHKLLLAGGSQDDTSQKFAKKGKSVAKKMKKSGDKQRKAELLPLGGASTGVDSKQVPHGGVIDSHTSKNSGETVAIKKLGRPRKLTDMSTSKDAHKLSISTQEVQDTSQTVGKNEKSLLSKPVLQERVNFNQISKQKPEGKKGSQEVATGTKKKKIGGFRQGRDLADGQDAMPQDGKDAEYGCPVLGCSWSCSEVKT